MYQMDEAVSLLEQKKALMTDFFNWTKAQTALIEHENLEFLEKNIEVKQTIIDKINLIDERYAEIELQFKGQDLPARSTDQIALIKQEINGIVAEAIKIDNVNKDMSEKLLSKYRKEMEKTTKAHNVMKAYNQTNTGGDHRYTGNFVNKQS